ncbi:chloride channel protein [Pseudoxanthomonas sp.]|uniref:chloride channel protein n=1 Tax=Pseudoxanthomonas sp. TaxID=1871049 RepID=UPI002620116A|nr:chloride channel protein [Pseudoxanthomonas sp.]WDS35861.1 MAG: chloride channel protein [Pseudoxanthomonas sp.]
MQENPVDPPTRAALPVAPSMSATLAEAGMPRQFNPLDRRVLWISALAMVLGGAVAGIARLLTGLIGLVTNLAFHGRWSFEFSSPAGNQLGLWVIAVPVIGGLIVGVMARWGSRAIRGHGIPEAMEQVLLNESRIPARMTWLKPVSSAVAIGTGGPFGAEGPIIATGGAVGSLIGQLLHVTADERKTLLAAGAAAGMAAVFSAPVSAVLLTIELLLFERRARSLIPVALAAVIGTGVRYALEGNAPMFPMPDVASPGLLPIAAYIVLGLITGIVAVGVTKLAYAIEDGFEKLPIHWMWWPALGGIVVGAVGYVMPATLGVGYDNIAAVLGGRMALGGMIALCLLKLLSWSVALGSGTSGGTLAPLFTIGGALGGVAGVLLANWAPWLGVDPRLAALVCMAAIFAGSSRAFLTSVVFAFETTQQPHGLLPLLGGCAAAYLISGLMMRNTIMTEKIVRRGVRVPSEYLADHLDKIAVGDACSRDVVSLDASQRLDDVRSWLLEAEARARHQGFPVLDDRGQVIGVVTRRNLLGPPLQGDPLVGSLIKRSLLAVREDHSLREAADHMVESDVGRLVVLSREKPHRMVGILTRGDLLAAHAQRLREARHLNRHLGRKATTR